MFKKLGLSTKLFITFVPIFIIGSSISVYLNSQYQEEQMEQQAIKTAGEKAAIVRESLVNMMIENQEVNDKFIDKIKTVAHLNDLYIRIDTSSLRLAEDFIDSARTVRLSHRMALAITKDEIDNTYGNEVLRTGAQKWIRIGDNFRSMIPFKAEKKCQKCHDVEIDQVLGVAHLEFPLSDIIQANHDNLMRSGTISGGFAFVTIIIGFFFYRVFVQNPIKRLDQATTHIAQGNNTDELNDVESNDEIGSLSRSFQKMQLQLEESQKAMQISTVGQVAASLVQDFRNPVLEIESVLNEMKKPQPDEKTKHALLEEGRDAAQRIHRMTQDLIDFTSGTLKTEQKAASVGRLVRHVTSIVKQELQKQGIIFTVDLIYDGAAKFDHDRTARALDNIIMYAANYVPTGGNITIQTDSERDFIIFRIIDNGSGIPKQFQEKIFEPFVKVVKGAGVGLDLALAKLIVTKQGGTISLISAEGKGSTYTISIPIQ